MTVRVVLADDQPLVRAGLRVLIADTPDLDVVGEAGTGAQAVQLARDLRPDVVVMDIRMPGMDGIEATAMITAEHAAARVVVLTTFDDDDYVYAALRAGASGFLVKDMALNDILAAIRVVAAGDVAGREPHLRGHRADLPGPRGSRDRCRDLAGGDRLFGRVCCTAGQAAPCDRARRCCSGVRGREGAGHCCGRPLAVGHLGGFRSIGREPGVRGAGGRAGLVPPSRPAPPGMNAYCGSPTSRLTPRCV
jgi:CheY-like chemotaxis protein